jgi:hypothetical protein
MSSWNTVDEGNLSGPSNWELFNGCLRQTSSIHSSEPETNIEKKGTYKFSGNPLWKNVIFTARIKSLDDGALGVMFRYLDQNNYYRFSMDNELGYRRLIKNVNGNFEKLWEDNLSYEKDRTYELTIIAIDNLLRGFIDGIPVFLVEDSDLKQGQIGLYCWKNTGTRFSQISVYPAMLAFDNWLLEESFDQFNYPKGYIGGDLSWTDYRVSTRVIPNGNDKLGVMFRYVNSKNYYLLSLDLKQNETKLSKFVESNVTELTRPKSIDYIQKSNSIIITIDCLGAQLTGYINGAKIFSVQDPDLSTGCIGLYIEQSKTKHVLEATGRSTKTRFTEVKVAEPEWFTYYSFGEEKNMPAGTCIRVYSGNQNDLIQELPNIINRFVASLDENGQIRLSSSGSDLRLIAPDGTFGHSRRFLPTTAFNSVNAAKVVRKTDGTGFFLVVPPLDPETPEDHYRLLLTYRRNNRTVDPDSQIFSQAGNTEDEIVTIDIPQSSESTE